MINKLESIQRLDELSLYLEINKYQTLLATLKNQALTTITDEKIVSSKVFEIKQNLAIYLKSVIRFGIDPTDKENLDEWMSACSNYINNLDMVEHTMFVHQRMEGKSLGLIGTAEYGKSSFLTKQENQNIKEQKIV